MSKNKVKDSRWHEDMERDLKAFEEFKRQMIRKLGHNSDKKHWLNCSYDYLFSRLQEEVKELQEILLDDKIPYKHKKMILECADIANFAMMIANKAKRGAIY